MTLLTIILRLFGVEDTTIDLIVQNVELRGQVAQVTVTNAYQETRTRLLRFQCWTFAIWSMSFILLFIWDVFLVRGFPGDPGGWTWWPLCALIIMLMLVSSYFLTQIAVLESMIPGEFLRHRWVRQTNASAYRLMDGVFTPAWTLRQIVSYVGIVGVILLVVPSIITWLTAVTIIAAIAWGWSTAGSNRTPGLGKFVQSIAGLTIVANAFAQWYMYLSTKGVFDSMTTATSTAAPASSGEVAGTVLGGVMICGLPMIGAIALVVLVVKLIIKARSPSIPPAAIQPTSLPGNTTFVPHKDVGRLAEYSTKKDANKFLKGAGWVLVTWIAISFLAIIGIPTFLFIAYLAFHLGMTV